MTVQIATLSNGLRIVTEAMPHLETASLGVWVGTGSRYEKASENGISHFLEHMAFKGTERRSAREIAEAIENVGGDINAATSLETTAYYARVLKDDVPLAIDVLADILQNSVLDDEELTREKDVIYQEIAAAIDSPEDLVFDTAQDLAFSGQAAGRSILGTPKTLDAFDRNALEAYMKHHYAPTNMVVSAAGAIDHDRLVRDVEEQFTNMADTPPEPADPASFTGGTLAINRPIEQTHLVLGFEAPPLGTEDYYTSQIFAGILGGGMSSRLFQQVREERGLCYSIYAYCWSMIDTGLFGVYAGTSSEQVNEMCDVIHCQLQDLAENGPGNSELQRAKAQMKSGLLMGLESSNMRAEQMARHLLMYGHVIPSSELIANIDAVTSERICAFAQGLTGADNTVWSEIGPARAGAPQDQVGKRQTLAPIM